MTIQQDVAKVIDPNGVSTVTVRWAIGPRNPEWTELWRRILVDVLPNNEDVTNNAAQDIEPAWSPDGRQIAFTSGRDGNEEIYVMSPDGSNQTNLTNNPADESYPDWSPGIVRELP